jgi:predicted Zn finger-like uncharacterized protein
MTIECPHCGADYPLDERQFAGQEKIKADCKQCNSNFVINGRPDLRQLPRKQVVAIAAIDGPARGQVFRLRQPRTILGRSGADVVLCDPEVSRKHCVIAVRGSTATLIDLGTTNGTFVGGERIDSCELRHLSRFRIGSTTLVFTVTDKKSDESRAPATLVVKAARR